MTRLWYAALSALALLFTVAPHCQAEPERLGVVTAGVLNVRAKPARHFERIAKFGRGDSVTVVQETDEWYEVRVPADAKAWVAAKHLDAEGVVTATTLQIRSGPGIVFTAYATAEKGTKLKLVGPPLDEWQQILAPPTATGWVSRAYVRLQDPAPVAKKPEEKPEEKPVVVAKAPEVKPAAVEKPEPKKPTVVAEVPEAKPAVAEKPEPKKPVVVAKAPEVKPVPAEKPEAKPAVVEKPEPKKVVEPGTVKTDAEATEYIRQIVRKDTGVEVILEARSPKVAAPEKPTEPAKPAVAVKAPETEPAPVAKPEEKPVVVVKAPEVKPAPVAKPEEKPVVVVKAPEVKPAPVAKPEEKPVVVEKPEAKKPEVAEKPVPKKTVDIEKPEAKPVVAEKPAEAQKPEAKPAVAEKPVPKKTVDIEKPEAKPVVAEKPAEAQKPEETKPVVVAMAKPEQPVAPAPAEEVTYLAPIRAPEAPAVARPTMPKAKYEAPQFVAKATPVPAETEIPVAVAKVKPAETEIPVAVAKEKPAEAEAPATVVEEKPAEGVEPTPQPVVEEKREVEKVAVDEPEAVVEAEKPVVEAVKPERVWREGVLFSLKEQAVPEASHILYRREGTVCYPICYLRSSRIPLSQWELREVRLYGEEVQIPGWSRPVIEVKGVQIKTLE